MMISLRSQAIPAARDKFDESAITQILKLLSYFWFDVLVARVEITKVSLKGVDFVEREIGLTQRLHAFHYVKQPAACLQGLAPEEKRPLPFLKNGLFGTDDAILNDMNLADF